MKATEEVQAVKALQSDVQDCLENLYRKGIESEIMLELGVSTGNSTHILLLACKHGRGHLWSVDVNPCEVAIKRMKTAHLDKYWTFTVMNDLEYAKFWNRKIDLLFIDTDHTFDTTLRELETYGPFMNLSGVIFLHDTITFPTVKEAMLKFVESHCEWIYGEIPTRHGLGKLTRVGSV